MRPQVSAEIWYPKQPHSVLAASAELGALYLAAFSTTLCGGHETKDFQVDCPTCKDDVSGVPSTHKEPSSIVVAYRCHRNLCTLSGS